MDPKHFHRDGYLVLKKIFDEAKCHSLQMELEAVSDNFQKAERPPSLLKLGDWCVKNPQALSPRIRQHVLSEPYQKIAGSLLGESVDFFWSIFSAKPAGGKEFPWHQDAASWNCEKPFVICWMALESVNEQNGCLWVVPGSHTEGVRKHEFRATTESEYAGVVVQENDSFQERARPVIMEKGDIVCFDSRLIHKSGINETESCRKGFSCAFVTAEDAGAHVLGLPEQIIPFLRKGRIV